MCSFEACVFIKSGFWLFALTVCVCVCVCMSCKHPWFFYMYVCVHVLCVFL
uniref:Uncharacterized protein n=1 Tax=Anguilla anguilla TaxID=7936 RepID=A0A0E9PN39_ANGAN